MTRESKGETERGGRRSGGGGWRIGAEESGEKR